MKNFLNKKGRFENSLLISFSLIGLVYGLIVSFADNLEGIRIFSNNILGIIRQKKFLTQHTIANKITGLFLFLLPLTLHFLETKYSVPIVCVMATFSAIHEAYYISEGHEIV